MSQQIRAEIPTEKASRYLQQLCKHWSHKFEVTFDAQQGKVALPFGDAIMEANESTLLVRLCPVEGADIARMQDVMEKHLDRFAFREGELHYDWQPV